MRRRSAAILQSGINVTSYVDILLVLLIIFMVIQPMARHQLPSRSPQQPEAEPQADPKAAIVLTIEADYTLHLNGQRLQFSELGHRLWEVFSPRRDKILFVKGSEDLAYGTVIRAVDIAKGSGVQEVALLTQ